MKYIIFWIGLLTVSFGLQGQPEIKSLETGAEAPDFNLPGVDGRMYSLSDFKQHDILTVIFTCNHCPTAQAYEDKLIKAVKHYRDRGVGFVAISPNNPEAISLAELGYSDMGDDLEDMKIRVRDKNYNFPYLYDGDTQKTSIAYGPVATPHIFIFDKDRKLQYSGRIDDTENPYVEPEQKDMVNALEALLNDKPVPVQKTKTFGCSVKWAWKDEWTKKLLEDWSKAPVDMMDIDSEGVRDLVRNESDKLRLINIWATWCGPCVIEFPEFITIDRMYRGRDFEFISVSADKMNRKEKALEFLKKSEASNKNYIFSGDNAYELIEAVDKDWQGALPFTLLIAPGGEILYKTQGMIVPFEMKKKIVDYLGRYYADDK
ncbi:MAG: redoxin family protein [Cyclobacteriaceae bacterium]|nr:redoxin family protein [Cyclobacteriaceae bacterium]